ncbi:Lipocalin-like domain-containing protein [Chryseobacterium sp. RU37D]|uniref:lipocalin family protein n=1 Tax=Chryseobacterium sp. RU37D TaxID=1907397 RepID=UPI0009543D33|nr:lipocalin family protein [Chryseobacterium sp. RU37D]SIQ55785.1 Lipocalin-like domain-containing protein [Chryseobacterium sp. RU37D]
MKKQLLLFAFSALALTSCDDDDIQGYEMDMMKGEWKTSKIEVISGKDDKTVISTDTPTGCSAKNITEYRTDYYTSYTAYTGVGADCQMNSKTEGTYEYNTDTKDLVIKYNNGSPRKYKVVVLTSSEMKLKQMYDNIDQNGDLIIDYTYISFKR